jgi:hypothetical protein
MVGLLLLKQLENLSDERVVLQFKRNPYYQDFCGYSNYMPMQGNTHFKNKIKTFNAYTLPKVHQLGGITRHTVSKKVYNNYINDIYRI